jgi:hypothetical protein
MKYLTYIEYSKGMTFVAASTEQTSEKNEEEFIALDEGITMDVNESDSEDAYDESNRMGLGIFSQVAEESQQYGLGMSSQATEEPQHYGLGMSNEEQVHDMPTAFGSSNKRNYGFNTEYTKKRGSDRKQNYAGSANRNNENEAHTPDWAKYTTGIGAKLMMKMGHVPVSRVDPNNKNDQLMNRCIGCRSW